MDEGRVKDLEKDLEDLKKEFHGYVQRKQQEEAQRLKTALVAAGTVIIALGSFIWWEVVWPVVSGGRR